MTSRLARFDSMSILIVDDDRANRDLLTAVLKQEGFHRITTESDSRLVADLLPSINPDLVLLDLHMPEVSGLTVLESITTFAAGTYLPVLVLTADATDEARDAALASGARDFLTKPLDIAEVVLRIANLLETRELYSARRHTPGTGRNSGEAARALRRRIQAVIEAKTMRPVFQPVVDLDTQAVVGHEALSRFGPPDDRGPAGWFSDAFQVGLGTELEWLAATNALPFLETAPADTFLAVNMSPASVLRLPDEQLCTPESCPQIVIELTEHVPVEDYGAIHRSLRDMRNFGARLAADDLGAGYAGFRHLIALEPDIIKLDISLVNGIHRRRGARALAKALVAFAADVDAVVIAEGVEEAGEAAELQQIGVRLAQGNYLGPPVASSV